MNQDEHMRRHKVAGTGVDNAQVAFCDSAAGLQMLLEKGLKATVRVRTAAPYLLANYPDRTEQLEQAVTAETFDIFKASIRPFVEQIYDICRQYVSTQEYARTMARATAFFHRTIFKALCLDEDDFVEPRIIMRVQTGDPEADRVLNSPWVDLLAENRDLHILTVPFTPERSSGAQDIDRLRRWLFRGSAYLGFRLGQTLSRQSPFLFRRDRVVYLLKENELVHETAFQLALRRIPLGRLARVRFADLEQNTPTIIEDDAWRAITEVYQGHFSAYLCDSARQRCTVLALEDLRHNIARQEAATLFYERKLSADSRRAIVLTNYPGSPEEYGLFAACDRLNIPLIAAQHGISRELNEVHGDLGVENSAAHLTAVFNDTGKRKTDATQFHHGASMAVGFPDKGRRLEQLPIWCFKKTEPVLFVSTNLYRGTVNTVSGSFSDLDSCKAEMELVDNVLSRLPHRVSYKPYPESLRYTDPDPALEHARRCDNLAVIEGSVDVRYYLRSASVVVSSRASSTTSWCILSGVPFCFIDVPQQMPLAAEAKEGFKSAFFYFSMEEQDVHAKLCEFLAQPIEMIRAAWREKADARQQFISEFIDKPTQSAGTLLSDYLVEHAFDPAFCASNAFVPPDRYAKEAAAGKQPAIHTTPLTNRT